MVREQLSEVVDLLPAPNVANLTEVVGCADVIHEVVSLEETVGDHVHLGEARESGLSECDP